MDIEKKFNEERCDVEIKGYVDTVASIELERVLSSIPEQVTRIVMDLSAVGYIGSSGLRVLHAAHKEMVSRDGSIELRKVPELVMKVLETTGFSKTLLIIP